MTDWTDFVVTPVLSATDDACPGHPANATLEDLSRQLARLFHERRYDDPLILRHMDPDIAAVWEDFPQTSTRTEYLGNLSTAATINPKYSLEVINTCSAVNEKGSIGTVWIMFMASYLPDPNFWMVHRETVVRLDWRRMEGE